MDSKITYGYKPACKGTTEDKTQQFPIDTVNKSLQTQCLEAI